MTDETPVTGFPPAAVHTVERTHTDDGVTITRTLIVLDIVGFKFKMSAADAGVIGRALQLAGDDAAEANMARSRARVGRFHR